MPTESEIISRLKKRARVHNDVLIGIGDDAAVIKGPAGRDSLVCCDLMIEGVHFHTEWTPPRLLGHKALAVNLSDIAAMGGTPKFAMVSIAFPSRLSSEFIDRLFEGLFELADRCGVSIVGGDTSGSRDSLFIDVSLIGDCETGKAVTRGGAKAGDVIYVSGSLGASALGLALLQKGVRITDSSEFNDALLKHLSPEPRLELGRAIGQARLATSMIDISDGLSTDLWHLLEENICGAVLHAQSIPIAECVRGYSSLHGGDSVQLALGSGEEYELLFTTSPEKSSQIERLAGALGIKITAIGEIMESRGMHLETGGTLQPLKPSGYEHII